MEAGVLRIAVQLAPSPSPASASRRTRRGFRPARRRQSTHAPRRRTAPCRGRTSRSERDGGPRTGPRFARQNFFVFQVRFQAGLLRVAGGRRAVPGVGGHLLAVRRLVGRLEAVEEAAVVRVQTAWPLGDDRLAGRLIEVMVDLECFLALLLGGVVEAAHRCTAARGRSPKRQLAGSNRACRAR